MKKFNKIGYLAIGMVLVFIIGTATPAFAAGKDVVKQLTAYFTSGGKPISVYVNDVKIDKDTNGKAVTPFTVNGTTYLPVKAIADALGKDIKWDGTTASVKITDKVTSTPNTASTSDVKDINKITTTKDAKGGLHDSITNYTFVMDKDAIGKWDAIDFVSSPDQFDSKNLKRRDYVQLSTYNFYDDGTMVSYADKSLGTMKEPWTKGYLIDTEDTIPSYEIKQFNGKTFMFIEWKSGDYTIRGQEPILAVYVKTSDTPDNE